MKLTPLEIRQQRFHVKFRGFDPEEVDTFLEMVAKEFEDLGQVNEATKREVARLKEECQVLMIESQRLQAALESAGRSKAETLEVLRAEAAEVRAKAAREAQTIVDAARRDQAKAREAVEAFVERRRLMIEELRSVLESQLRLLDMEGSETPSPVPPKPRG